MISKNNFYFLMDTNDRKIAIHGLKGFAIN